MADAHAHGHEPHVTPLRTYFMVYGSLIIFTVVTYLVSFADLGGAALPVAMVVAVAKAMLVILFFMHLLHDEKYNALILVVSLFFMALFFTITMADLAGREIVDPIEGTNTLRYEQELRETPEVTAPVDEVVDETAD